MSPAERLKALLFLALFSGAAGALFSLLSCGTEYWLLAAETCGGRGGGGGGGPWGSDGGGGGGGPGEGKSGSEAGADVRIFHEGLFWRCSFTALSADYSTWDLWISKQPPAELCKAAFLFPFPANEPAGSWRLEPRGLPAEPYEPPSAIVFRTFWSIFLVVGLAAIVVGGFVVICAGPPANPTLYKVGGALQICGGLCLLAVLLMYLTWVQVLDTLEQFARRQRVSGCPAYHLSVQHGPSFLLAPVAVFFSLLAGLLSVLVGRAPPGEGDKNPGGAGRRAGTCPDC